MSFLKKIIVVILTWQSKLIIKKYKPFVVAVTGSVGKTSTKDAIYEVLKNQDKFVRKSEKSMNSEIGLPLTIMGVPNVWNNPIGWLKNIGAGLRLIISRCNYPDCLILEIGADHPGDIKKVTKWLHPDISVITKISRTPVHVEFFKSPEEVFEEKAALATAVKPGGTLVLFADDDKVLTLKGRVEGLGKDIKVVTYGLSFEAKIRGNAGKILYEDIVLQSSTLKKPIGFDFSFCIGDNVEQVTVKNIIGNVYIYPLLAATAVGIAHGFKSDLIAKLLSEFKAPKGRMNLIAGLNNSTIIDDTYNSSPDAAVSALETLKDLQCVGRKIAVLGDMAELGKFSGPEHRKVGKEAVGIVDKLITVGRRSQLTADEVISNGFSKDNVHSFSNSSEAAVYLTTIVQTGDIILIKGSQSMRMERVVAALMNEPRKAGDLLVRQEREWLEKK